MKSWISLKTFSNRQAAQATKHLLETHGVLAQVHPDDSGETRVWVELTQTEKAQKLIHS
jgi:hypothetical protein